MRFSRRTSWDRTLTELARKRLERDVRGAPVLDLTLSNPLACGIPALVDTTVGSTEDPGSAQGPRGLLPAREAVSSLYKNRGVALEPGSVLLTSSTSEGYSHLLCLLCDPGDEVLVPRPSYPLLDFLAEIRDVSLVRYPLVYAGEWHIDLEALRAAVTDRTRAVVLIHPNNPTGSYVKAHERRELVKLARERDLALIADEVFWWYPVAEAVEPSLATEQDVLTFTLNGISKLLGLPHLKLGWITLSGPPELCREAQGRLEIILDIYLSVGVPVQTALPRLLQSQPEPTGAILDRVRSNVNELQSMTAESDQVSLFAVEGGWTAVLRLPSMRSGVDWSREFLDRGGVLVHPGELYGWERESVAVISLLVQPATLRAGVRILLGVVQAGAAGRF